MKRIEKIEGIEDIGLSKELIEKTDNRNIYIAKKIVDEYDFGRELTREEKRAIIQSILKNSLLKKAQLSSLVQNLQKIDLSDQEVYGAIINLGINGNVIEERGYSYTELLENEKNACRTIEKYKDKIETNVTEIKIQTALSKTMNEEDVKKLKQELEMLGLSRKFIDKNNDKNLYMASRIVDEYDFGRELTREEKRAIIQSVLTSNNLNKAKIYKLAQMLEKIGLLDQEVYGTIINLGINRNVIEETGYDYSSLLINLNNARQTIGDYKYKIETNVTEMTIQIALSKTMNEEDVKKLKQELEEIGIIREFIDKKDDKNLYMAKSIVEGYDFGRKLTQEEKRVIIQFVLSLASLNRNKSIYLYKLVQELQRIGLGDQEVCGTIINVAINGRVIEKSSYDYSSLLTNRGNACQTIAKYKNEIQTQVTEETILKALNKAEKMMQKALKSQKNKGKVESLTETRTKLEELVENELSAEIESQQGSEDGR